MELEHEGDHSLKFKVELGHAFGSREQFVTAFRYEVPLTKSSDQGTYLIARMLGGCLHQTVEKAENS